MTIHRRLMLLALALYVHAAAAQQVGSPRDSADIRRFWTEVNAACAEHDYPRWQVHFADDAFFLENTTHRWTKAEVWTEVCMTPQHGTTKRVDEVVRTFGNTILVSSLTERSSEHNGKLVNEGPTMWLDAYERRHGQLVQIGSAEIPIYPVAKDPVPVRVDRNLLDAYAGEYLFSPGKTLLIYRDGDRLMGKGWMDKTGQEFTAENDSTFFSKGESWRQIFVRGSGGVVAYSIFRDHGIDIEMPRVP